MKISSECVCVAIIAYQNETYNMIFYQQAHKHTHTHSLKGVLKAQPHSAITRTMHTNTKRQNVSS